MKFQIASVANLQSAHRNRFWQLAKTIGRRLNKKKIVAKFCQLDLQEWVAFYCGR